MTLELVHGLASSFVPAPIAECFVGHFEKLGRLLGKDRCYFGIVFRVLDIGGSGLSVRCRNLGQRHRLRLGSRGVGFDSIT